MFSGGYVLGHAKQILVIGRAHVIIGVNLECVMFYNVVDHCGL
jgi:hypothetical protein